MPISLASKVEPANNQTFYLVEDVYIRGGLQIRDSLADRDSIALTNLKLGALVLTIDTGKLWKVSDLVLPTAQSPNVTPSVEWQELTFGGSSADNSDDTSPLNTRLVAIQTISSLPVDTPQNFTLELGASCIILKLAVSRPIQIQAFGTSTRDEDNPYTFIATADHLVDDGRSILADGTIIKGRNYSIFANFDDPATDNIYFTATGVDEDESAVTVTITYIIMEKLSSDSSDSSSS